MVRNDMCNDTSWYTVHLCHLLCVDHKQLTPCCTKHHYCRKRVEALVAAHGPHPAPRLQLGWLKDFADGSLGSRTALFWDAYADDAGARGASVTPLARLEAWAKEAHAGGAACRHPRDWGSRGG